MLWLAARVALVACSLALDVFAVSIGVGMRGLDRGSRVRIGASFACAEVGMSLVGAGLGAGVGRLIGDVAGYLGFAALVAVGVYMLVEQIRESEQRLDLSRGWGLLLASLSISVDSLGIGFSIAYLGVPLPVTLGAIAVASVLATSLGLAFGRVLGERAERVAGVLAGVALIGTGLLFAALKHAGVG